MRTSSIACGFFAGCGLLVGSADGGVIRHDRDDAQYRNLSANFPSVGAMLFATDDTFANFTGICSGVLITPEWVLTAAHCVDFNTNAESLAFSLNGNLMPIVQRVPHPQWNGSVANGFDIGLARLATPITTITPATLVAAGVNELGRIGTFTGFGTTGNGDTGSVAGTAGTKRAGNNVVDFFFTTIRDEPHYLGADFDSPRTTDLVNFSGSATPLDLEYLTAGGDSGGGVFIDFGTGPLLAAVNSFGSGQNTSPTGRYGDLMGATRVSLFRDFIDATIPEPSIIGLIAFAGVLVARRRR